MPGCPSLGSEFPLSNNNNRNNNNNNNRRRGRGNNRSQGGGPLNRIDSRARGNAPQMLEKYRKLAQDASMNGDRVQAEYYLQFADHYFRVIADSRVQKDDPRGPRPERGEDEDYFEDEFDRGQPRHEARRREEPAGDQNAEQPREESSGDNRPQRSSEGQQRDGERQQRGGENQQRDGERQLRDGERQSRGGESQSRGNDSQSRGNDSQPRGGDNAPVEGEDYQAAENPFTRPAREKPRRPRRERTEAAPAAAASSDDDGASDRLDPSVLPGAISSDTREVTEDSEAAPAPARRSLKPRTRTPRRKDSDEELEAVG